MSYEFKSCSVTGLPASHPYVIEPAVERLIRLNMVTSFIFLLAGGAAGLFILLTRWQAVHLLTDGWFYTALSFHGMAMLVAWIVFMEMAILYITSSIILNCRLARNGWPGSSTAWCWPA